MKKISIICSLLFMQLAGQSQLSVDLSTGKNNSNGALIAAGGNDDTWTLIQTPGGTGSWTPKVAHSALIWANSHGCARWITPALQVASTEPANQQESASFYIYEMTFNNNIGTATAAALNISTIAGDNALTSIEINGNSYVPHSLLAMITHPANAYYTNINVTVNPAHVLCGTNTVRVKVKNGASTTSFGNSPTGFFLCGTLNVSTQPQLVLNISGNTNFCLNSPLSFTGSSNLTLGNTFWEIAECDANGNYTNSSAVWNSWISGTPGQFTFSTPSWLTCGKHYKIKLAGSNTCGQWVETNKIIYIDCPKPNLGADKTICKGSCVTLGTKTEPNTTYEWTPQQETETLSSNSATVCPDVTTSYMITATNSVTGCTNTDVITVNVVQNDPTFQLTVIPAGSSYCNVSVQQAGVGNPVGYGYGWWIDEWNGSSYVNLAPNPCNTWWTDPNAHNFPGFDGLTQTYNCLSSVPGKFKPNTQYRITRGTWNTWCPWKSMSIIFTYVPPAPRMANPYVLIQEENGELRKFELPPLMNDITVYPNPSTGEFTIDVQDLGKGVIEVYDMTGKKVESFELNDDVSSYRLDLTGYAKGVYMLNVVSDQQVKTKKLVIE
jgi:hypothetical protein